jgi:tRNA (guanine37-N1)-methyltransferase
MAIPPDRPSRSHGRLKISASLVPRDLMEEPRLVVSAWKARVITLFPDAFPGTLGLSLTGKALELGLWSLQTLDLRSFGEGRHRNVDETPAGGGAGMVLRADVVDRALRAAAEGTPADRQDWPVVYLSPRGKPFTGAGPRGRGSPCCAAGSKASISASSTITAWRKSALATLS